MSVLAVIALLWGAIGVSKVPHKRKKKTEGATTGKVVKRVQSKSEAVGLTRQTSSLTRCRSWTLHCVLTSRMDSHVYMCDYQLNPGQTPALFFCFTLTATPIWPQSSDSLQQHWQEIRLELDYVRATAAAPRSIHSVAEGICESFLMDRGCCME